MNTGTKIRTILTIATCLNTALMATDLTGFSNATIDSVYKIVSIVLNFIIVALSTYFNNDYTEEGCVGTAVTRQLKAEKKEGYMGDYFFTNEGGEDDE